MESNNTVNHEALGYFSDAKFFEYPVTPQMENLASIQAYFFLEHVLSLNKIKDQLSDYSREFHESIAFEKSGSVPNEQVIREALEDCVREIVFDEHNECDDMIEVGGFYFDGESFFQVMGSLLRGLMNSWWTKYALCRGVAFLGGDDDIQALSMVVGLDNSLIGHAWSMVDSDFPDEIIRSEGERIWTPSPESVINIIRDAVAATDWCGHDVSITHEPNKNEGCEEEWIQRIEVDDDFYYTGVIESNFLFTNAFDNLYHIMQENGVFNDVPFDVLSEFYTNISLTSGLYASKDLGVQHCESLQP